MATKRAMRPDAKGVRHREEHQPSQNVQLGQATGIGHNRPRPQLAKRAITGMIGGKGNLRGSVSAMARPDADQNRNGRLLSQSIGAGNRRYCANKSLEIGATSEIRRLIITGELMPS